MNRRQHKQVKRQARQLGEDRRNAQNKAEFSLPDFLAHVPSLYCVPWFCLIILHLGKSNSFQTVLPVSKVVHLQSAL